jgi:thiosulfate/3-mercaptopyruvate sulfurtransferase
VLPALLATALAAAAPFVSVDEAGELLARGATVLDAREARDFRAGHLPGARRVDWKDFRDGWGRTGRLGDDGAALAARLSALGVDGARPVVVYGAAQRGWGEEGRIAWMLAYLGHPQARILDGGFAAWREAGRPIAAGDEERRPPPGRFSAHPVGGLRADLAAAGADGAQLLDVRSRAEYDGATPWGEARGGHLPRARHLEWSRLLDEAGRLRPAAEVRALVVRAGLDPARPVIVYCTGGVRSAHAWAALTAAGVSARNYDGSFWEWARHRELPVEGSK